MPIGEIENHPYLHQGEMNGAKRLILGSFPVYECTDLDNDVKAQTRLTEGTVRFFYGSVDSSLWRLYKDNIDNTILLPPQPNEILQSLNLNDIAISDTIVSCERHGISSEDTKLIRRVYNTLGVRALIHNGVRKILCTSKGVLSDLEKKIIVTSQNPIGRLCNESSYNFQSDFVRNIGGNPNQINNLISKVFIVGDSTVIALAIPSPGSPQRRLFDFGFEGIDSMLYANDYFTNAFSWLKR